MKAIYPAYPLWTAVGKGLALWRLSPKLPYNSSRQLDRNTNFEPNPGKLSLYASSIILNKLAIY
jgi:hypothetical protein